MAINPKFIKKKQENEHRINQEINVAEVRLVGENITPGVYHTDIALKMAREQGVDLVEISPNAAPPVCKIIDYNKFLYDKKKKEKEIKARSQKNVMKEIRFTPNTDEHDFEFKTKHAIKFLEEGAKVKAYVHFRGRAIQFKDRGELLLLKFVEQLKEFGALEALPKLEGNRMNIIINPKSNNKKPKGA
ncbi:translation initiation factor IF-3 [Bacteroidota bacterium]|nr:translation initiation factor IF-3 [Bacteroidota bacterium]